MDVLTALLIELIVIAVLFEIARRLGLPYPALFVLGGLALGFVPWIPHITLEPDLVLLVFLPPLLFGAAFETPQRDLRANIWPITRLSIGLVILTTVIVAAVAQALVPGLGWAAAFALGAIVAPTDALAATTVFRRLGVPRLILTLVEGEALFNDASALILYRAAVVVALGGAFVFTDAVGSFVIAAVGGIAIGYVVGRVMAEIVRWLDDPPVEVVVSLLIPFAAYLPAEELKVSGVLAVVTAGPGHRPAPRDDALAQQPGPVAHELEDGHVHPQRPRVRAPRASRSRTSCARRRRSPRPSSWGSPSSSARP